MEVQSPSTLTKVLIYTIGVLAVIFIAFSFYRMTVFRLVSTDPSPNNFAAATPFFKATFNRTLSKSTKVVVNPSSGMTSYSISGKTITVFLNTPLFVGNRYGVKITNISDSGGGRLKDKMFSFLPQNIPSSDLPKDQQKYILNKQTEYNKKILEDKLVSLLPFTSGGNEYEVSYTVSYANVTPKLIIEVTYTTPQSEQDAISWIKSVGANPSNYDIQYVQGQVGN